MSAEPDFAEIAPRARTGAPRLSGRAAVRNGVRRSSMASKEEAAPSLDAQIAAELQRNRDLTYKLYVARGEVPPDDNACAAACPASPTIRAPLRSRLERVVAQERVLDVRRAVRGEAAAMGGLRLPPRRGLPLHRHLQAHAHRRLLHVLSSRRHRQHG